jgi:NADH-quinone oxidoreductase subunit N
MDLNTLVQNLSAILPVTVLVVWACALLIVDLWVPKGRKGITALLAVAGMLAAMIVSLFQFGRHTGAFNNMVAVDGFAVFLNVLFLGSGIVAVALAYDYVRRMGIERGEFYVLLMFSISGMMLMAVASDLIMVFLALELLSLPLYVLAGIARPRLESEEASLKYFLLGAYSAGFVLYGVALVFGATGHTQLTAIVDAVSGGGANLTLLAVGAALILIGLGFKVAAVPFHMWTPDVYQGAPSPVTGFMAIGAKAGGFAALLRVFFIAFPAIEVDLTPVLWALAALTMILGNVVAIAQTNIKRLLAYSSIANAGYIFMALVPYGQEGVRQDAVASALFFLFAYALTNFAAWAVVIALERSQGAGVDTPYVGLNLDDYAGLGRKHPGLAAAMTVAMLSFIGLPPTLGFVGKFYLFRTVLEGGFVGLAIIGVVTSLISAYYYLRVVVIMYMRDGDPVVRSEPWLNITAAATAVATVVLTFLSAPLFNWASQAVLELF